MMFKTLQRLRWIVVSLAAFILFHVTIENSAAKKWEVVSQLPTRRSAFSTAVGDGKIYLIGGYSVAIKKPLKTVEVYDPETGRWGESPPMLTRNSPFGAEAVNGKIYILGSERKNGERSLDVEVFDDGGVTAMNKLPVRWGELKAEHAIEP